MPLKTPHPADVYIGSRIRYARIEAQISQEKLGEELGLTFQQVQKYEKGANRVGGSRLWEISKILNVPPGFFFEGLDGLDAIDPEIAVGLKERTAFMGTTEGSKLMTRFQDIESDAVRRDLLGLMASLSSGLKPETE